MINNKIINKKAFLTRNFLIASVLFSGIFALFVLSISGISDEYNSDLLTQGDFSENYDTLSEQTARIETARSTASAGGGLSFIGTFDVAFQSTFTVIQMVFQSLTLFGNMSDNVSSDFELDPQVVSLLFIIGLAILTILIVWNWISSISRGKI